MRGRGSYGSVVAETVVWAVSPATLDNAGGAVTITGLGFTGATSVKFGATSATSVVVVDDKTITCTAPVHVAGAVDVTVVTPLGTGVAGGAFTYAEGIPRITSITPNSGTHLGGTPVTIAGTDFTGATGATVGGVALTSFVVVSDISITGTTGAHAAGAVNVVVTNTHGPGTGAGLYTYT